MLHNLEYYPAFLNRLTVTKVVFELMYLNMNKPVESGLTVTKVVFECIHVIPISTAIFRLTVTKVVFE